VVQSWEQIKEDHFTYFDLIDDKFGGRDVPKYLIGYSFGGLISTHLTYQRPRYFNAVTYLAPYYQLYDETMWEKYRPFVEYLNWIIPYVRLIPVPSRAKLMRHLSEFIFDPVAIHRGKMPVRNVCVIETLRNMLTENKVAETIQTPFLILHGENDKMCAPSGSTKFVQ
jgi:acylglycerol lipase